MSTPAPLAEVDELVLDAGSQRAPVRLVDGISWTVRAGESVGLVGESGSGKTLSALALIRLLPPSVRRVSGRIRLAGVDVTTASESTLEAMRGGTVGFAFQEAAQALNPVLPVWRQVSEAARLHEGVPRAAAFELAVQLLSEIGVDDPADLARAYPHELSGGQRQRVVIAAALSGSPEVLIADEPTSALDPVSSRALLERLGTLVGERGVGLLLISHDLRAVASLCSRVFVVYAGETVELGPRDRLLSEPEHPYTQGLLGALGSGDRGRGARPQSIPGSPPRAGSWSAGCRFAARCPFVFGRCREEHPGLAGTSTGRASRCFLNGGGVRHE